MVNIDMGLMSLTSPHVTRSCCQTPPLPRERALSRIRKSRVNKARGYPASFYRASVLRGRRVRRYWSHDARRNRPSRGSSSALLGFDLISKSGIETSRITARAPAPTWRGDQSHAETRITVNERGQRWGARDQHLTASLTTQQHFVFL